MDEEQPPDESLPLIPVSGFVAGQEISGLLGQVAPTPLPVISGSTINLIHLQSSSPMAPLSPGKLTPGMVFAFDPPSYEEASIFPPSHPSDMAETTCRVCKNLLRYQQDHVVLHSNIVRCPSCNESNAIGAPPVSKQFVICTNCNALLIANVKSRALTCPRLHCQRTIILAPPENGKERAFCSKCNTLLSYKSWVAVVVCPKCLTRSRVSCLRLGMWTFLLYLIALTMISFGIGFAVHSYRSSKRPPSVGLYFIMLGPIILGITTLVKAFTFTITNFCARQAHFVGV